MSKCELEELKYQLNKYDYVSFDVFDTLLIRDFLYPIDVFKYIENSFNITDFQHKRINAEVFARSSDYELADISYRLIYSYLDEIDENLELNAELKACIPNHNIREIYDEAVRLNKRIIAISDMYLEPSFIKKLLEINGYKEISDVFVSSALNKTKGNGQLFMYVLNKLNIKASSILHIGDNYHSDYLKAKEQGILAHHFLAPRDKSANNPVLLKALKEHHSSQASLFAGLLVNNYNKNREEGYWHQFGFEYAGILLYGFVNHIYKYCKEHKITRIYFMARDGKVMKDVFDYLYNHDTAIETHYMWASRRLFFVPSLKVFDEDTIVSLIEAEDQTPYIDIINRFGFKWLIDKAIERFDNIYQPITSPRDREKLKHFFLSHKNRIFEEILKESESLQAYLRNIDFFKDDHKLLVDVGWGCSSQKYLESIIQEQVHGIYFGTHKLTYKHKLMHGYIFDQGLPKNANDIVMSALPVAELLFVGNHYSIVKLDKNLNPIYHEKSLEEEQRIKMAASIHKGTLYFIKNYKTLLTKYNLSHDESINTIVLNSLINNPKLQDIKNISMVPHAASMGESSYEPIIKNLEQTQMESFKNILLGRVRKNRSLWPAGKVRYKKLLNKKHYKSLEYLSLVITKIQHCYSYSFSVCFIKIKEKLLKKR